MALYYILDGTININTQDYAGWSALHEACNKGYYDIVRMLVKHGANVNLSSHDGTRYVHYNYNYYTINIVTIASYCITSMVICNACANIVVYWLLKCPI